MPRTFLRLNVHFPVFFRTKEAGPLVEVDASNLSTTGLAFTADALLPQKSLVYLEFRLPGRSRTIRAMAEVVRQQISTKDHGAGKPYHTTGVKFLNLDSVTAREIGDFIRSQTAFPFLRSFVLIVGVLLSLQALFRAGYFSLVEYCAGTPFGKEWFYPTSPWLFVQSLTKVQALFGTAMAVSSICFFAFRSWSRKALIFLSLTGLVLQAVRLTLKLPFFAFDFFFHAVYGCESLLFSAYLLIFSIVSRKRFAKRFDAVLNVLKEHLEFQHGMKEGKLVE